jgi:predicted dehydrogenase
MKRIGMGLVGPGFIAAHHLDAVRRLGNVDIVAIAGSNAESAAIKARQLGVSRAYGNYVDLIEDPDIDVVHITTPNYLHYPIAMAALTAGKHLVCDKPLATSAEEGHLLRDAALDAGVANVVVFNYRGNPLVQQARAMAISGTIGDLRFVQGSYLQDWMTDPHVYSWRSDPRKGGPSSALSDIGTHWCDLAEHVTGRRIEAVLADLTTTTSVRYTSGASSEAFSHDNVDHLTPVRVDSEDLASVLLRFQGGARGCFSVGQTIPGHKNDLQLEVSGSVQSLRWRQEVQNELWIGKYDAPNAVMAKDPALVLPHVKPYVRLPGGHQESWADAFFNVISAAYGWIRDGGTPETKPDMLPTFSDGYRSACIIEAILRSHSSGGAWEQVRCVAEPNKHWVDDANSVGTVAHS